MTPDRGVLGGAPVRDARLLALELERQARYDEGQEEERHKPLPRATEGDRLPLDGIEDLGSTGLPSITNLQRVTTRLDRQLNRFVHPDRPGALTVPE
jgi:hypothetical protein